VLNSDADVAPPRKTDTGVLRLLRLALVGARALVAGGDWSALFREASFAGAARDALKQSLSAENLKQEAGLHSGEGRSSFERPYGTFVLLQLCAELREWDDPQRGNGRREFKAARGRGLWND